ncbi:MAG: hypothetical protein ACE5GX_09615 [Thermoanaerobaculia bacterium]
MARRLVPALVAVALGWSAWSVWNSDARRLARRLAELQELASKSPVENQFQGAAKAKKIADLFAATFELRAEPESYATSNRQDLIRAIVAHRARSQSLSVEISREELFVEPGGASATHYAYVEFFTDLGDLRGTASYPFQIQWAKEGGKWRIRKAEILSEAGR